MADKNVPDFGVGIAGLKNPIGDPLCTSHMYLIGTHFSILQSALRFADVEVIAVPTTCLVNNLRPLGTIQAIFVGKEIFDSPSVKKNNFELL